MPEDTSPPVPLRPATAVAGDDIAAFLAGAGAAVYMRDVITVEGRDAVTYLQGQLSQDIEGLAVGASALTFVLEPQGRIVAVARVSREAPERVLLDVETGLGEAVLVRLMRFKLRTKADIKLADELYLAYRGPLPPPEGALVPAVARAGGWDLRRPLAVVEIVLPDAQTPIKVGAIDALRVQAGVPAALDLDERAVPAETGIVDVAASFTKGCYTGQELVARMDSRVAEPPRRIRRITGDGVVPLVGASLEAAGGREGVTLTSVVVVDGRWTGLALVPRAVDAGTLIARWPDGTAEGTVEA